jgi:hypothetical protein
MQDRPRGHDGIARKPTSNFSQWQELILLELLHSLWPMSDLAILYQRLRKPITPSERWLGRAVRARGIAMMLSRADAKVVEAYAAECEAKAKRLEENELPIAA